MLFHNSDSDRCYYSTSCLFGFFGAVLAETIAPKGVLDMKKVENPGYIVSNLASFRIYTTTIEYTIANIYLF